MESDAEAAAPLISHLKELANQERTLMQGRALLRGQHQSWHTHCIQLSSLEAGCQTMRTNLQAFDFKQRRMVLDALGFSAHLYRSDHEPRYVISASIDEQLVSPTTCGLSPCSGCGQSDHSAAAVSRCFSRIAGSDRARPDPRGFRINGPANRVSACGLHGTSGRGGKRTAGPVVYTSESRKGELSADPLPSTLATVDLWHCPR